MAGAFRTTALALLCLLATLFGSGCPGGKDRAQPAAVDPAKARLRLAGFAPLQGAPGDPVLITGSALLGVRSISFGGVAAPLFHAADNGRLYTLVPPGAVSGKLRLAGQGGHALSSAPFTVRPAAPRLIQFSPERGPAGTRVLLTGTSFTPGTQVRFGELPAAAVTVHSPTRATATVPEGFATARLTVRTEAGQAESAGDFTVVPGNPHLVLELAGVVISQGSQTPELSVPLVANRNGFLAAGVLANLPNQLAPVVRIHLQDGRGREVFSQDIPAPAPQVPLAVDPADLGALWTLPLDGRYIQPGCRLLAELIPEGSGPGRVAHFCTWPRNGRALALNVKAVPTIQVTLLPVTQDGLTGNVDDPPRRLADWVERFRAMFPLADVEVLKGEPIQCSGTLQPDSLDSWHAMAGQVEAQRLADGKASAQFYCGVVKTRYGCGIGGYGIQGSPGRNEARSILVWDRDEAFPGDNSAFPEQFAHEMGHVMGRGHADSAPPDFPMVGVDPAYPYPKADIGAFGIDVAARRLKQPGSFKDIMSGCPFCWVSDYTYRGILDFLMAIDPGQR